MAQVIESSRTFFSWGTGWNCLDVTIVKNYNRDELIRLDLAVLTGQHCIVKGATSRFRHLEIVRVRRFQSVLILAILNHLFSFMVCYYLFGAFLSQ